MLITSNRGLQTFLSVCESKTVRAAAEKLGITQTAATKRLQLLEADLQASVFIRSRRGMVLTDEGRALLQLCKEAGELEGQFQARISGKARAETSITVVGPTTAISHRIAENCLPLYRRFPFLRLHLRSDDHADLVEKVRRGEADLAVVPPTAVPNEMESKVLKPERYVLVGTPKWKNRPLREILASERSIDFYESDRTTFRYLEKFHLDGRIGKTRLFVNENEALVQYICKGIGFATLAEPVARPFLDDGRVIALNGGRVMEEPLALVWFARSRKVAYFDELVRSIR